MQRISVLIAATASTPGPWQPFWRPQRPAALARHERRTLAAAIGPLGAMAPLSSYIW